MFFFILAGLIALWLVGSVIATIATREPGAFGSAALAFIVGLIVVVSFSVTTVDARAVGIQTSFGKYVGNVDNGLHFVAPWSSVEEFSTRVQTLELTGDDNVRISFDGGASGSADVTVRWRINEEDAGDLWARYREFEEVQRQLVTPEARNAFRTTFSGYSPTEGIDGAVQREVQETAKTDLSNLVKEEGVIIDSVSITRVNLSDRAQNAVDRVVEAEANTERATAEQERATIEAETARIRQQSQTPEALQRYCLEVLNSWDVTKNGNLPATLNCNFGEQGQVPVIVGQ